MTVSVTVINTDSKKNTSNYSFIGIIFAGVIFVGLSVGILILYHYKTRKVLFISGLADEVNVADLQYVLPGAISVYKNNDEQLIIFDTNTNAKKSYYKCNNKSNSIIFRNSKIRLKWKPMLCTSDSSGIDLIKLKKSKNPAIPEGYREFHGFFIPDIQNIEKYEHKPQDNTHTLGEGDSSTVIEKIDPKSIH